jgi:hypothetical protein
LLGHILNGCLDEVLKQGRVPLPPVTGGLLLGCCCCAGED